MQTYRKIQDVQFDSLINEGQYARLTKFLSELQTTVESTDQSNLKNITATALQICLFCQQCQMEMEWHKKADHEARLRLSELNVQLDTLLSSIIEYDPQTESQCPAVSVSLTLLEDQVKQEVSEYPNLWQRIRNLFGFKSKRTDFKQLMAKVEVNTSFSSAVEKKEHVSNFENPAKILWPKLISQADTLDPSNSSRLYFPDAISEEVPVEQDNTSATSKTNLKITDDSTAEFGKNGQCQNKPPSFMIYCLGSFRVYQNDQLVQEWPSSKGKSVFKYLVAQHNQPIPKEVLMELFWPDAHPDAARNNLNVSIYGLRQALRNICPDYSHILFHDESYQLNPEMTIWIDVEEFVRRIQIGHSMENQGDMTSAMVEFRAAEALYQGEFLAEDRYEDWLVPQRKSLEDNYLKLLDNLGHYYLENDDVPACVTVCSKMLVVDPCREEAHRQLMHCYSLQGQPYLALRQFHMCQEVLKTELDLGPSESTIKLYQQIRAKNRING